MIAFPSINKRQGPTNSTFLLKKIIITSSIATSKPNSANYFSYSGLEQTDLSQPLSSCLVANMYHQGWLRSVVQSATSGPGFSVCEANELLWGSDSQLWPQQSYVPTTDLIINDLIHTNSLSLTEFFTKWLLSNEFVIFEPM